MVLTTQKKSPKIPSHSVFSNSALFDNKIGGVNLASLSVRFKVMPQKIC